MVKRKIESLPKNSEYLSKSTSDGTISVRKDLSPELKKYLIANEKKRMAEMKKMNYAERHKI